MHLIHNQKSSFIFKLIKRRSLTSRWMISILPLILAFLTLLFWGAACSAKSTSDLKNARRILEEVRHQSNPEKAIALCQMGLSLVKRPDDAAMWAEFHAYIGSHLVNNPAQRDTSTVRQAMWHLEQAAQVFTKQAHPYQWALTQSTISALISDPGPYRSQSNIERAIKINLEILEVAHPDSFRSLHVRTLNNMGTLYMVRKSGIPEQNLQSAIQCLEKSLSLGEGEVDSRLWATINASMGIALARKSEQSGPEDLEKAIHYLTVASSFLDRSKQPLHWRQVHMNLGHAFHNRRIGPPDDNTRKSINHYLKAEEVTSQHDDPLTWAKIQQKIGSALTDIRDRTKARTVRKGIQRLRAALAVQDSLGDTAAAGSTLIDLARAYADMANHWDGDRAQNIEIAIEYYLRGLSLLPKDDVDSIASVHLNLCTLYSMRLVGDPIQNLDRTIAECELATEFVPLLESREAGLAHIILGNSYLARGDEGGEDTTDKALEQYRLAANALDPVSDTWEWSVLLNQMGVAYLQRSTGAENEIQAIRYFLMALEHRDREKRPLDWANIQYNIARAYMSLGGENALREAIVRAKSALEIFKPETAPRNYILAVGTIADVSFRLGEWEEAAFYYDLALQSGSKLVEASPTRESRLSEMAGLRNDRKNLAYSLAQLGRYEEAVTVMEAGLAAASYDVISLRKYLSALSGSEKVMADSLLSRLTMLESAISRLPDDPAQKEAGVAEQLADIRDIRGRLQLYAASLPVDVDIPSAIAFIWFLATDRGGMAIIQQGSIYRACSLPDLVDRTRDDAVNYLTDERYGGLGGLYVFLDDMNHAGFGSLDKEIAIAEMFRDLEAQGAEMHGIRNRIMRLRSTADSVQTFSDTNMDFRVTKDTQETYWVSAFERTRRYFGQLIWPSIDKELQAMNASKIVLIPSGHLAAIPIHAACYRPIGEEHEVLPIERYEIAFSPSRSIWSQLQSNTRVAPKALFADASWGVTRLPVEDLLSVARLFENGGLRFEKMRAGSSLLESAEGATWIHFYGHAAYDWLSPGKSRLYFGRETENVRYLCLDDIRDSGALAGLPFVVLAGCETGVSKIWGREVDQSLGFPSAFLTIGARGTIGSLVYVDNLATALLFRSFYRYLLGQEPLSPAAALGKAQLELRDITAGDVARLLRTVLPRLQRNSPGARLGEPTPNELLRFYAEVLDNNEKPFSHSRYWAPFYLTGRGFDLVVTHKRTQR